MMSKIESPWNPANNSSVPLPEYPRPQMIRDKWKTINGFWDYAVTEIDSDVPGSFSGRILVPFAVETAASGVGRQFLPNEKLWYRRSFTVPEDWQRMRILLNFEAVDWKCSCTINGKNAGSHTGGYTPFSFDITKLIHDGENELILSVTDPTDTYFQQRGKQVLNPGTIYYTATSGIWQTVWLEAVPAENHITQYTVCPGENSSSVEICCFSEKPAEAVLEISENSNIIHEQKITCGTPETIQITNPRLWSAESPFLYDLKIKLADDEIAGYFALRNISVKTSSSGLKRIFMNNQPVFLHAPLDQGYWPESGMTPPSDEAMIFDIERMKELGFNSIRKHIKIEPRRWYYHADRLGMPVMQDMVSGGSNMAGMLKTFLTMAFDLKRSDKTESSLKKARRISAESRSMYETELLDMINHLKNHPSVIMWIPFNESWGQFDSERIQKLVEQYDPTRPVDPVSGWYDQGNGDFRSRHTYFMKLKRKPRKDTRVYFISEYGGYNLPERGHQWDENRRFGYRSCKTKQALESAYKSLITQQLIPLIKEGLGAAVYTQLSDVEIENNGIYSYDRKVLKLDAQLVKSLNEAIYREFRRCERISL